MSLSQFHRLLLQSVIDCRPPVTIVGNVFLHVYNIRHGSRLCILCLEMNSSFPALDGIELDPNPRRKRTKMSNKLEQHLVFIKLWTQSDPMLFSTIQISFPFFGPIYHKPPIF